MACAPEDSSIPDVWVTLDVGGKEFRTNRSTIAKLDSPFLNNLLENKAGFAEPEDSIYKIDRDPNCFSALLQYARSGQLFLANHGVSDEMMRTELDFYLISRESPVFHAIQAEKLGRAFTTKGSYFSVNEEFTMAELRTNELYWHHDEYRCFNQQDQWNRCTVPSCDFATNAYWTCSCDHDRGYRDDITYRWCHRCRKCYKCWDPICVPKLCYTNYKND